ncbi:UNKNOWN [Stylonychia lemnae]|uniref:RING-type domain-containing protein n=1 Tax=Stylonychia lemnae TaxID=5949 RepID=A0A077ZWX0_STYLE|nr:UNKNOWN [Stylonychia lemnae]|eukprot:CDW72996.1 UNKNOWN [Stylonychia lemnae]
MLMTSSVYQIPTCAICLQDLTQTLSVTKCGHVFHHQCITQAVEKSSQCPLCRKTQLLENIIQIKYGIHASESLEAKELFGQMTDDEKKNVLVLQRKIYELTEEKQKLMTQIAGLSHQKNDFEKQNEAFKIQVKNQGEEMKKQRNVIAALENKIEVKSYVVDEGVKEKKALLMEKESLMHQLIEIKKLNLIHEQIEKCSNKANLAQVIKNSPDQTQEQIANSLYQYLRIQISQEDKQQQTIQKLKSELDQQNHRLEVMKYEVDDYKKRIEKLKRKARDQSSFETQSLKISHKPSGATGSAKQEDIPKLFLQNQIPLSQQHTNNSQSDDQRVITYNSKKRKLNLISNSDNQDSELFISSQDTLGNDSQKQIEIKISKPAENKEDSQKFLDSMYLENEEPNTKFKKPAPISNSLISGLKSFKDGFNVNKFKQQIIQQKQNDKALRQKDTVQLGMGGFFKK